MAHLWSRLETDVNQRDWEGGSSSKDKKLEPNLIYTPTVWFMVSVRWVCELFESLSNIVSTVY